MSQRNCWGCGSIFYTDLGATRCPVCIQTEAITKQHQRQVDLNRQHDYEMQRQNDIAAANRAQAIINAEQQRIAAIASQTQAIFEIAIRPKDAYNKGYNYIDDEFVDGNQQNLNILVQESGITKWTYDHPFVTPTLQEEFRKGLRDRINGLQIYARESLLDSAYRAGRQIAEGTLSSRFSLYTGITINGKTIRTDTFDSHFSSTIDEKTGELKMGWQKPFKDEELNEAFSNGASEVYWEVNTEELKESRLLNEVAEIKRERHKAAQAKSTDKLIGIFIFLFPFIAAWMAWELTEGWFMLGLFVSIPFFMKYFAQKRHEWQCDNWKYLYSL